MSNTFENEDICTLCDEKFIDNDIAFSEIHTLKPNTLKGDTVKCNICGELTPCDKEI
ncbi:hypothetical protein [Clostridium lacusfryxellense]|uniref:hypothetical protein n=1 Tax=Clostridium lacusfryxellense TaxID=205328 RepID=UPI001C0AA400|nr:hypothetical protein [Clostridium lacusfryxellense]MBU3110394.1 hypothetical protein [Clostridium lacusfryxellense]